MSKIQAIRGTRDILPSEVILWQQVESVVQTICNQAIYQEIRTPIFEQTSLFERGIGVATDVVGKEMYSFLDRGDRQITLRPEGTAGVVRAYLENKLFASGGVQRLWYRGPMFRYERPQAGRQRQFHQIGLELIGTNNPRGDVEVMAIATNILTKLGLKNLSLEINSVGNGEDRQRYKQALIAYLTPYKSDLDTDSQDRLDRNPLRILDSKDAKTQEIAKNAPNIIDYLDHNSKQHFDQVCNLLSALNITYQLNPRLVRGLDYYTHTAFEIVSSDLGAQATVCGGGRYDGLVQQLGGNETPAVGWAMGIERLILLLQQVKSTENLKPDFYMISQGELPQNTALILAQKLREHGLKIELDLSGSGFAKQFKKADKSGAKACLVLGESEIENNTIQLKWLENSNQETINQADLITRLTVNN